MFYHWFRTKGPAEVEPLCLSPPPHSSAFVDAVVRGLGSRLQGLAGSFVRQVRGRLVFTFVLHNGLPVLVLVGLLTARQLQEGGQAMLVGHFVEGAQQEVHHHQTHKQVDYREDRETRGHGRSCTRQNNVLRAKERRYLTLPSTILDILDESDGLDKKHNK